MSKTVNDLAKKVVQLPAEDRAYLTECLLASLDESDLEQQWKAEAIKRRNEVRSGRVKPISSDAVYREIDELLKK
jgi:putative addiction module component (TIGR02574 family)